MFEGIVTEKMWREKGGVVHHRPRHDKHSDPLPPQLPRELWTHIFSYLTPNDIKLSTTKGPVSCILNLEKPLKNYQQKLLEEKKDQSRSHTL